MLTSPAAFAIAAVIAFIITPAVRRLAERFEVIDKPDRHRKRHRRLTPLWGGLAIFIALTAGAALALHFTPLGRILVSYRDGLLGARLVFLLLAGLFILAVGLRDDYSPLPPKVKLLTQLLASALVVFSGFRLEEIALPGGRVLALWTGFGVVAALVWLTFMINAFNFIDGLDGLACSQAVLAGALLSLGGMILAVRADDLAVRYQFFLAATLAAAAAGSGMGFWRFNRFPARIFLGDAGSTLLGFVLGVSALLLLGRGGSGRTLVFVALTLSWPLFDALQVTLRRLRSGDPISKADNRHLHHYLMSRGFTTTSAVAFINVIVLILGLGGLAVLWLP